MHIFIMSVIYLQSAEKIQWKLLEELISQSMPYQPLFTWRSHPKMAKRQMSSCTSSVYL